MWVNLSARLGLNGPESGIASIRLEPEVVGTEADLLGAYHILEMGRHFDDYVVTDFLPSLPPILNFPVAHPYLGLSGKIRSSGVTGNVGEAVTALFARRVLQLGIGDVAHIRPTQAFSRRKAPDYLLRVGDVLPGPLDAIWPVNLQFPHRAPEWWPAEAKARTTPTSTASGITDALKQLAGYWHTIHRTRPREVGFGMVVSLTYQVPRKILVSLFVPRRRSRLLNRLRSLNYADYLAALNQDQETLGSLHGC